MAAIQEIAVRDGGAQQDLDDPRGIKQRPEQVAFSLSLVDIFS